MHRGQAAFAAFRKCDARTVPCKKVVDTNMLLPVIPIDSLTFNNIVLFEPPNVHNIKYSPVKNNIKNPNKNNIDYFYRFNDILREDFTDVINDPKIFFSTDVTQYLHDDLVATIDFKNSYWLWLKIFKKKIHLKLNLSRSDIW